ncbi:DUF2383 domain-containing protein [uncultured Gilvimarinus sp.]|uniref:DUF2383 domain-containing protein n=1 Tax=uncultured Gilvimarinus sp. TaxID=1689143 RepID=UPI0030ED0E81
MILMEPTQVIDEMNDLLDMDRQAIIAYRTALKSIEDEQAKLRLSQHLTDYKLHSVLLRKTIVNEGGTPHKKSSKSRSLSIQKVAFARTQSDQALLRALGESEKICEKRYQRSFVIGHAEPIQTVLQKGLDNSRRHMAWLGQITTDH